MRDTHAAPSAAPITPLFRHHCTCDHDFSQKELEFLAAMEEYKRRTGKKFPTWTEALHVLMGLGYAKMDAWDRRPDPPEFLGDDHWDLGDQPAIMDS